ncbi:hypothetical protein [Flavobacterium sp.]|uniref:hypothetical protein n=1 Tax=Flavobacterium sp. TaxID=239 RepID=UPI003528A6FD
MRFLLILILFFCQRTFCQSDSLSCKSAFYFEVLGHTRSLVSLNYEKTIFSINDKISLNTRIGVGYNSSGRNDKDEKLNNTVFFPSVFLIQFGKKTHFINMGLGYSLAFSRNLTDNSINPPYHYPRFESAYSLSIGYKFQKDHLFVQFYPVLINTINTKNKEISAGLSFGFAW